MVFMYRKTLNGEVCLINWPCGHSLHLLTNRSSGKESGGMIQWRLFGYPISSCDTQLPSALSDTISNESVSGSHEYCKSGGLSRNQEKEWAHRDPVSTSLQTIHNFSDLRDYDFILLCGILRHVVHKLFFLTATVNGIVQNLDLDWLTWQYGVEHLSL